MEKVPVTLMYIIYRTEVTRKVGLPGAARMRSWPLIAGHVAAVLAFDDVIVREVHLWCTKPKPQNDCVCQVRNETRWFAKTGSGQIDQEIKLRTSSHALSSKAGAAAGEVLGRMSGPSPG